MLQTNLVDLTKKVQVILEKKQIPNVVAQVGFAADVSGSIQGLYSNGTMQLVVNRLQAVANKFDDNGSLDMWVFDDKVIMLEPAVPDMFGSYVNRFIMSLRNIWGATQFTPVLTSIRDYYFGTGNGGKSVGFFTKLLGGGKSENLPPVSQGTDPVYLVFLTDGENSDLQATIDIIEELASKAIYIQFIGVGQCSFHFIRALADKYGHVGFTDFSHPERVTDDEMFNELLNDEFVAWAKGH